MADGINRATLLGNLGADPELRYTNGGEPVLNIRLATTTSHSTREGTRAENTEWHSVKVWGQRAEGLAKVLCKGSHIYVEGRIHYQKWTDRDGNERISTEIKVDELKLCGGAMRPRDGGNEHGEGFGDR